MNALQGGHPPDDTASAPASAPTAPSLATEAAPRPRAGWRRTVVAGSAAVSVGVLVLGSVGLLFVAAIGVGLDLAGMPTTIVWPAVGIAGLAVTVGCCRLAYNVWRYETDDATDII